MSGVMIKTAIYGMVRVIFDLIGNVRWEWGMVVLVVGAATTLFGVLYALMQHDLKRLLAYHSVENIGIILLGLGMAMVFIGFGHPAAGVLALIAALYHTLNHAVFKGLLFLGAGSILHSTGLRNLNDMGGLIRGMPKTALYFLIGALAISALPPLNGFVSEWLTFQAALQATILQHGVVRSLLPLFAATLALAGALTAMCFVKVYGIAFLCRPRPCPRSCGGGASTRAGCASGPKGTGVTPSRLRECRTPRMLSVSRSATCSDRSTASNAGCRVPTIPNPGIRSRSRTAIGTGCTCPWRGPQNSSPRKSRCCNRAGSASTCSTASSP